KDLELKSSFGYSNSAMKSLVTYPLSAMDPAAKSLLQNSTFFADASFENWIVEPQLSWTKDFTRGKLDILAGTSFMEQVHEGNSSQGFGFSSEALMKNIDAAD